MKMVPMKMVANEDDELIGELTDVLQLAETDMTIFFRLLASPDLSLADAAEDAYYDPGSARK